MSEDKYVDNENVSVSEPQNESNTDAQKPLSIEDALAAAELAAGELETMAAADGEIHTAKEKPETGESAAQELKKPTSERQPTKKPKTKNNRKRPLRFPKDFARNSRPKRTSVCLRFSLSCCPFFARR